MDVRRRRRQERIEALAQMHGHEEPPAGLSKNQILALGTFYTDVGQFGHDAGDSLTCFCMADIELSSPVIALACVAEKPQHVFHFDCMEEWLSRQGDCPFCRRLARVTLE